MTLERQKEGGKEEEQCARRKEVKNEGRERGKEKEVYGTSGPSKSHSLNGHNWRCYSMKIKNPNFRVRWIGPQIPAISGISSEPVPSSVKIREGSSLTGLYGFTASCVCLVCGQYSVCAPDLIN